MQEMMCLTKNRPKSAHLPHQPFIDLGACGSVFWQKFPIFFGQIDKNSAGFHQTHTIVTVNDGWDFVIWADFQKCRAILISLGDIDGMHFVIDAKLFEKDRYFAAIRGCPCIKINHASIPFCILMVTAFLTGKSNVANHSGL